LACRWDEEGEIRSHQETIFRKGRCNVLSTLENQYGFRHDTEDVNMVFICDEKTGSERLVKTL
jgi:hypothetical protein